MSGRKSRDARRVATPPPPVQRAALDRRLLLSIAALVAVLVAAAIVGLSLALGGTRESARVSPGVKLPQATWAATLFNGIPQHGLVLGAADAPVSVTEYLDLQCPWCGKFARDTWPTVVARFVRAGKARVEIRPLDFVGSDSVRGRNALLAAAGQNKAFQFAALLYANQGTENTGWLNGEMVRAAATSIAGLDVAKITAAGASEASARIEEQRARQGVTGVPTFFVKRSGTPGNGTMLVNPSPAALIAALRNA